MSTINQGQLDELVAVTVQVLLMASSSQAAFRIVMGLTGGRH